MTKARFSQVRPPDDADYSNMLKAPREQAMQRLVEAVARLKMEGIRVPGPPTMIVPPRRKVFLKADGIGAWGEQLYSLVFLDTGEDVFPLLGTAESWRWLVEGSLGLVMVEAP